MRPAAAGLLVGCVLLMALAPASAAFSVRRLIGLEDASSEEGASTNPAILPVGMDLGRIQSFLQSVVTGASAAEQASTKSKKYAAGGKSRRRSEYEADSEEEEEKAVEEDKPKYPKKKKSEEPKEEKKHESHKHMCKQVLLEEEDAALEFIEGEDKATITTLQGTCANKVHPLPTLGGGCAIECEHDVDLLRITEVGSHSFSAPAHFKPVPNYYPVSCSFRTDGPLKGACRASIKVACCSNKEVGKAAIAGISVDKAPEEPKKAEVEFVESESDYLVIVTVDTKHIKVADYDKYYPAPEEKPAAVEAPPKVEEAPVKAIEAPKAEEAPVKAEEPAAKPEPKYTPEPEEDEYKQPHAYPKPAHKPHYHSNVVNRYVPVRKPEYKPEYAPKHEEYEHKSYEQEHDEEYRRH